MDVKVGGGGVGRRSHSWVTPQREEEREREDTISVADGRREAMRRPPAGRRDMVGRWRQVA